MATPNGNSVSLTGDPIIDGLTQGSKWELAASRNLTFSLWDSEFDTWSNDASQIVTNISQQFSNVANINFQFDGQFSTVNGIVDLNFYNNSTDISIIPIGNSFGSNIYGIAAFPDPEFADSTLLPLLGVSREFYQTIEGDIGFNNFADVFDDINISAGGQGFFIALHELGHAVGLKHPHDGGGNDRPTFSELSLGNFDSNLYTVMSYNPVDLSSLSSGNPATLMPFDIAALQHIYGVNTTYNTGDDTYALITGRWEAIWDAGGVDTISAVGRSENVTIDLREGFYPSLVAGGNGGYMIAFNAIIENASGGSGNDILIGNSADNFLVGNAGGDFFSGGAGNDRIDGGGGADEVDYSGDAEAGGALGVTVNLATGVAIDGFGDTDSLTSIELVLGTNQADILTGSDTSGAFAPGFNDFEGFRGLGGNDTIDGGAGFDYVQYSFDAAFGGASGVTVNFATGIAIDGFGNTDTLISIERVEGTAQADILIGGNIQNDGFEAFRGLAGNDFIDGGSGTDSVE